MTNTAKQNFALNLDYLLKCCNITYTQSTYKPGRTIPNAILDYQH